MGYGARVGLAEAEHDPLHARALYLRATSELLLVACDLCLMAPAQAARVRTGIQRQTGVPAEHILVACIHTHSGPDTGLWALLTGHPEPEAARALLAAAERAGVEAVQIAAPARLGIGHAQAAIGRNRRRAGGPVDPDVLVARVDRRGGAPLALLYLHGCHPTVLGHDNLAFSADWPWAAGRGIAQALPGVNPIFLLAAHGDVDPRTRGLLDLAIPGQSLGVGFDQVEALGRELGDAVAEAAARIETREEVPVGALQGHLELPVHRATEAEREAALAALDLPETASPDVGELFRLEHERTAHLPADERRERVARVRLYLRGRTAARFAGSERPQVEVQVLRVGEAHLLALPAEATVDVGRAWKTACGAPHASLVGIANGWLRYLPHPRNFQEPGAHRHYEILMSTLEPPAAELLVREGLRLDRALDAALEGSCEEPA